MSKCMQHSASTGLATCPTYHKVTLLAILRRLNENTAYKDKILNLWRGKRLMWRKRPDLPGKTDMAEKARFFREKQDLAGKCQI